MTKKYLYIDANGLDSEAESYESTEFKATGGAGSESKPVLTDANGYIDSSLIRASGQTYTVGTGGVTIGDVVYISAADTVLPYATLTDSHRAIGIAASTESAAANVSVLANDTLASALTSATAGTPYYWDGSTLSTTIPSGSGSHVWQAGVAKNATDLHIEVRFIKKNQ